MTDWISFAVAFGIVAPWLLAGACLLAECVCEALNHRWRMRTDPIYRDVETEFRTDLAEGGLDGRTIPIRSIIWWSSVVATAGFLSHDMDWLFFSMRWLWSMTTPLITLEITAILVAASCLNLTAVSCLHRLRAFRNPAARRGADDSGDLLQAAEALSAQYAAIADGDRRRAGE